MKKIRCAIYTCKSSEEGLEQEFNSLDAQREACVVYITSQKAEGWGGAASGFRGPTDSAGGNHCHWTDRAHTVDTNCQSEAISTDATGPSSAIANMLRRKSVKRLPANK